MLQYVTPETLTTVPTGRLDSVVGTSDSPPMSRLDLTPGLCWRPHAPVRHIHVAPSILAFHDNWRGSPCRATAAPSSKWNSASHWICPMSAHTILQPWQVLPFLCLHFFLRLDFGKQKLGTIENSSRSNRRDVYGVWKQKYGTADSAWIRNAKTTTDPVAGRRNWRHDCRDAYIFHITGGIRIVKY